FAVFLLGTELIATLMKKDVLLLRGLFRDMPQDKTQYLAELMNRYGFEYKQGEYVFRRGENSHCLFYIVAGSVQLIVDGRLLRELQAGDYFGEMALLTDKPLIADAMVNSTEAKIVVISAENIETLLMDDPRVAMSFLKQMAARL